MGYTEGVHVESPPVNTERVTWKVLLLTPKVFTWGPPVNAEGVYVGSSC